MDWMVGRQLYNNVKIRMLVYKEMSVKKDISQINVRSVKITTSDMDFGHANNVLQELQD